MQITECTQQRFREFTKTLRPNALWEALQTNLVQPDRRVTIIGTVGPQGLHRLIGIHSCSQRWPVRMDADIGQHVGMGNALGDGPPWGKPFD